MGKERKRGSNYRNRKREITNDDLKVKAYESKSSSNVPHNDPEWYIYDKDMFDGVISMPTLEFKGEPVSWNSNFLEINAGQDPDIGKLDRLKDFNLNTPTVACYMMNPGLEFIEEYTSSRHMKYTAINVAARKMYAELSASNAKTSLYAPQDIATLILALGQVIAMVTHLKRMYGIANHFNFYSRKVPKDIFEAMGVSDYEGLTRTLANFRNRVNQLIARIDTIQFPTGMSYFKKCEYMYQNVFVDRDEKMVTYHLMAPNSTWILDEEAYQEGTILKTLQVRGDGYATVAAKVEDMIERILTSSTFNTIFADIINLANRNVLTTDNLRIDMLPIDYSITPIYSEQFNWQVMNMSILPFPNRDTYTPASTPLNDVYPDVDNNILVYSPSHILQGASSVYNLGRWIKQIPIRLPDTNPSQDMFVELLAYHAVPRLISQVLSGGTVASHLELRNIPDFWCSNVRIIIPAIDGLSTNNRIDIGANYLDRGDYFQCTAASQFVHFPFMGLINLRNTDDATWVYPLSRLSAYTQVTANAIMNLRYQTFLGLFSFRK